MMNLLPVFYQILVLFMILIVGFIIYRLKVIDDHVINGMSKLVIDVTMPALIITSMNFAFSLEILRDIGLLLIISLALYLFSWILAIPLSGWMKVSARAKDIYQFMLIFPNVGFMGYPVIDAIYGRQGLLYAAIFNFTYGLVVWTLGVWIFRRREGNGFSFNLKVILTPGMIAVLLGFFLFLFSVKLPYPVYQTLNILGHVTTPLSMIVIGALMGRSSLKKIWSDYHIYLANLFRLVLIPIMTLLACLPFGFSNIMLGVSVIMAGMPAAANTAMFAERYSGDADLGARAVFISNLFSILTIPGLAFLLQLI